MDSETFKLRQQFLNEFFNKDKVDFLSNLIYLEMGDFSARNSITKDIFYIDTEALFKKSCIKRHIPFKNYHNFLTPYIYFLYSFTRQKNFLSESDLYLEYLRIDYYADRENVNCIMIYPPRGCLNFLRLLTLNSFIEGINSIYVKILTYYRNINNEQYIRLGGTIPDLTEEERAEEEFYEAQRAEQEYYEVEDNKIINSFQCFKSEECVICLTNPPNVLFCNCGHLCYCSECEKLKNSNLCPICKTENNIIRILE